MKIDLEDKQVLQFFRRAREKGVGLQEYLDDLLEQLWARIQEETDRVSLKDKLELSKYILRKGLEKHGVKNSVVAWTGGKDSTLILWLMKQVVAEVSWEMPRVMFINEGHVFEEVTDFVKEISEEWGLTVDEVHNADVSSQVEKVGEVVKVADLDRRNRKEVERLGYKEATFVFEPESLVGNHLMKTVAMNRYLEQHDFAVVVTGIRWDEQGARDSESYFSKRGDEHTPEHMRVHPILHLTERDIWDATLENDVPYCSLYEKGYRSLGAKGTTQKAGDKPAWKQDFEKVSERAGRKQDKEEIMQRLRDLGYM